MEEDLPSPPLTSHASGPTLRKSSSFFSPQLPLPFLSTTWTGLPFPGGPALTPASAHSLHSRPPISGLHSCYSYIQLNLFPFCNSKAMHVHVIIETPFAGSLLEGQGLLSPGTRKRKKTQLLHSRSYNEWERCK